MFSKTIRLFGYDSFCIEYGIPVTYSRRNFKNPTRIVGCTKKTMSWPSTWMVTGRSPWNSCSSISISIPFRTRSIRMCRLSPRARSKKRSVALSVMPYDASVCDRSISLPCTTNLVKGSVNVRTAVNAARTSATVLVGGTNTTTENPSGFVKVSSSSNILSSSVSTDFSSIEAIWGNR